MTQARVESAAAWLTGWLTAAGGQAPAGDVIAAAAAAGHTRRTIYRARDRVGVLRPPGTYRWRLPARRCPHCGGPLPGP